VFHVELRRFPHVARAFNLSEDELQARILVPWMRGNSVELEERRFSPDRARLTIYEGPAVATEDRGLGRGWSTVTRDGVEVTTRVLAAARGLVPQVSELKQRLLENAPLSLRQAVSLAGESGRPSERLAAAEQAVWELLHEGRLTIERAGGPVPAEQWESLLLAWESWGDPDAPRLVPR
jgi:hypothetical protein